MDINLDRIWELAVVWGIKVIAAIAILVIGAWIAKLFRKIIEKVLSNRKMDATIGSFVANLAYYALLAFVILAALGKLGIQTTSFVAVIGAAGLAIGLALQGSLANFAAGFLMIIFRPFKVGDYIDGAGTSGTVEKIQIFTTQLLTADNKTVIVPNASLTSGNIVNYSSTGTRRIDMTFGIGYEDDIDKAKQIITDAIANDERVLRSPEPLVAVSELADSSVNIVARPWSKSSDYWGVYFALTEKIKKRFDQAGISIPYPQRDVHLYEYKAESAS